MKRGWIAAAATAAALLAAALLIPKPEIEPPENWHEMPSLGMMLDVSDAGEVCIAAVRENSLAESVGVQPGDVLTAVNDTPVTDDQSVRECLQQLGEDESIVLQLVRSGETVQVTLR